MAFRGAGWMWKEEQERSRQLAGRTSPLPVPQQAACAGHTGVWPGLCSEPSSSHKVSCMVKGRCTGKREGSVVKHGIRPRWGALVSASLLAGNVGRVGEPGSRPIQDGSTKFPTWGGFLSMKGHGESFQPWGVGCGWAGGRGAGHGPAAAQLHNLPAARGGGFLLRCQAPRKGIPWAGR